MRFSFVRFFVVTILVVSLTLIMAPTASAAPARDTSEWSFRDGIVRIVRVMRNVAKKTTGMITSNVDGLAPPRP
jgi:hypothetical protein